MIIKSDWHTHSEFSYDASLPLEEIAKKSKEYGFVQNGITDHLNFNDEKFVGDINVSAKNVKEFQKAHPTFVLGVELTPIAKPEFDYIAKNGTREGYVAPQSGQPYDMELALTKEELMELGIRYAVGAAHWRVDVVRDDVNTSDVDACIKEWYRQQMWLACDERVTILGHPWYNGKALWYDDFTRIPHSMNMDIGHALKENKKFVECNSEVIIHPRTDDKYRMNYVEFLRELFEMGVPITYGSDSHGEYHDKHIEMEKYLEKAGFKDGDFSELTPDILW